MKNPVHPGELVKANLEELGLSVAVAAKALGVTRQQLYNVIGGRSAVTPEMAVRFEKAFGGSADMWLRMQAAYDLAQVRRHDGKIVVRRLGPSDTPATGATGETSKDRLSTPKPTWNPAPRAWGAMD